MVVCGSSCPTIAGTPQLTDLGTITDGTNTWRNCGFPTRFTQTTAISKAAGVIYSLPGRVDVGTDQGPTPVEYLLHGIAACLTAGIANIAAARGVTLTKVESSVEGDIDLLGILGLSDGAVRNGYEQIRVTFHIEGDADDETLRGIVEQSRRRSAVYDVLTQPTPVVTDVVTG